MPKLEIEIEPDPRLVTVSIKIPKKLLDRIDELAKKWGVSRSEILRYAIISYISRVEHSEAVAQ